MPTDAHWTLLQPEQARQLFHVPPETATVGSLSFYELSSSPRTDPQNDGPWPLLALQRHAHAPQVVTLHWATVDAEHFALASYNPLEWPGGYLLLDSRGVAALVHWLQDLQGQLPSPPPAALPPFTPLPPAGLAAYGLDDERHEGHRQSFHLQPADPLGNSPEKAIVILSAVEPLPAWWLFLGIRRVLPDPGPAPADQPFSPAYLNLDRPGLAYLADTLAAELPYLVRQP